ncbi:MAG TPA: hypothetical protein VEB86_07120 [Chryseosolibacter sp.]|nr:hypothetical protein [Chryseosolibacter sp.]
MTRLFLILFLFLRTPALAQPGTEIYLFDLSIKKKSVTLSNPVNITNRKGYDNQPSFHPDEELLYYVAADTAGESDIVVYDLKKRTSKAFTDSPEREYSPALTPDKKFISAILQRSNGAQDLVRYPVGDGNAEILISNLICGYYAFMNSEVVGVFALPAPFTLHLINLKTRSDTVIADSIGRSLHKVQNAMALSFIEKKGPSAFIRTWDIAKKQLLTIGKAVPGREYDMAWAPGGLLLMSDGSKLFCQWPDKAASEWREVKTDGIFPSGGVTRIAVNPAGTKVAVVISE